MEVEGIRGAETIWQKKAGRCVGEWRWVGWRQIARNEVGGEAGRQIFEVSFILPKDESLAAASSSAKGSNERYDGSVYAQFTLHMDFQYSVLLRWCDSVLIGVSIQVNLSRNEFQIFLEVWLLLGSWFCGLAVLSQDVCPFMLWVVLRDLNPGLFPQWTSRSNTGGSGGLRRFPMENSDWR